MAKKKSQSKKASASKLSNGHPSSQVVLSAKDLSLKRKPFPEAPWVDVAEIQCVDERGMTLIFYAVDVHERELVEVRRVQTSIAHAKRLAAALWNAAAENEATGQTSEPE